jgi:hypothetical protein
LLEEGSPQISKIASKDRSRRPAKHNVKKVVHAGGSRRPAGFRAGLLFDFALVQTSGDTRQVVVGQLSNPESIAGTS